MKHILYRSSRQLLTSTIICLIVFSFASEASASVFSDIKKVIFGTPSSKVSGPSSVKSEATASNAAEADAVFLNPNTVKSFLTSAPLAVDDFALVPGEEYEPLLPTASAITEYTVRKGDTLSEIAEMFGISVNTLLWTNNLTRSSKLSPGDRLVILPINGISHTVKKGETLESIVKKHKGDVADVLAFNGLEKNAKLAVGDVIVIPNGEPEASTATTNKPSPTQNTGTKLVDTVGYFLRPITGGVRTRGIHGFNGIDIAAKTGTPIYAAQSGKVIVSRNNGAWNGGYGNYVVVSHANGMQTLYAHMSKTAIDEGVTVDKGDLIGYVGNTGKSTGPHLHFEVRGGKNPF